MEVAVDLAAVRKNSVRVAADHGAQLPAIACERATTPWDLKELRGTAVFFHGDARERERARESESEREREGESERGRE